MGLAIIAPLLRALPLKPLLILLLVAGLAALVLPAWQFSLAQPAIAAAYHQPISLGWGWWLTAAGLVLSLAASLGLLLRRR
jgi:hypothetical protein